MTLTWHACKYKVHKLHQRLIYHRYTSNSEIPILASCPGCLSVSGVTESNSVCVCVGGGGGACACVGAGACVCVCVYACVVCCCYCCCCYCCCCCHGHGWWCGWVYTFNYVSWCPLLTRLVCLPLFKTFPHCCYVWSVNEDSEKGIWNILTSVSTRAGMRPKMNVVRTTSTSYLSSRPTTWYGWITVN